MGSVTHHDEPDVSTEVPAKIAIETDPPLQARKRRIAALRHAAGIWARWKSWPGQERRT
jgi:hypothetical protein